MPAIAPYPAPASHSNGSIAPAPADGQFYDDELPPELFDREEDMEDLQAFLHVVAVTDDTF